MKGQRGRVTKGTENHNGHKGFCVFALLLHTVRYRLLLIDYEFLVPGIVVMTDRLVVQT